VKRLFTCCLVFLAGVDLIYAHPYEPPISLVPSAENVYLTRVTSVSNGTVTFTIAAVLKGKSISVLLLKPDMEGEMGYPVGSEWLLASCSLGYTKDSVGMPMEGYCGWIPNPVVLENERPFVKTGPISPVFGVHLDTAPDGTQGLTLEHVKQLISQNPKKS
jgi:hypothetical protein